MFWGGMRRGEIYGLKPEDLNWDTSKITIRNAWQRYDSPENRSLGDPKWHKPRRISFPLLFEAGSNTQEPAFRRGSFRAGSVIAGRECSQLPENPAEGDHEVPR
jgi:integrase